MRSLFRRIKILSRALRPPKGNAMSRIDASSRRLRFSTCVRASVGVVIVSAGLVATTPCLAGPPANQPAGVAVPTGETPEVLPHVVIAESAYDFGTVKSGSPVEHRFLLQNTGKGALKILKMHTSCGCTAAVLDSDTVAPGATTFVKATFDTTGFQGPKMKTVRLYTNDPKQASFTLTLQGTVEPDVQVSALRLGFGDVVRGQSPQQEFTATVDPASPIKIVEVVTRSPYLVVKSQDIAVNGRPGKKVQVTLRPDAPIGAFRERVSLKTSSTDNPVVNVPVLAMIQGDIELEPSIVSFGVLGGPLKTPLYRDVVVRSRTGKPVNIESVDSDNSSLSARILRDGGKTVIRVTVGTDVQGAFRARLSIVPDPKTLDAGASGSGSSADSTNGTVTAKSADADQRQLYLPVFGIVSRPAATSAAAPKTTAPQVGASNAASS